MFDLAFNNIDEVISMNGHGIYVWSVYIISTSIIIISFLIAKNRIKGVKRKIKIKNAPI
tara:strand:- start:249 stop:425 length:177 start_codon:yes stop_codon:yes gene_type:complete